MGTRGIGAAVVAAAVIAVAGCGGGDSASRTTSQTTARSATDIKQKLTPEGNAQARRMVVTIADMPTGWREDTSPDEDSGIRSACSGLDFSSLTLVGKANGRDLTDGDGEVQSAAAVFDTPDAAADAQRQIGSDATNRCVGEFVEQKLKEGSDKPDGVTFGDVQSGRMSFPKLGDGTTALRITIPMSAEGMNVDFNADIISVRQGAALVLMYLVGGDLGVGLDSSEAEGVAQVVAARMRAATGTEPAPPTFTVSGETAEAFAPDRATARRWCRAVEAGKYDDQLANASLVTVRVAGASGTDSEICIP